MTGTANPRTEPSNRVALVGTVAVATVAAVVAAAAIAFGAITPQEASGPADDPRRDLVEQLDTMEQEARRSLTEAQQQQEALDEAEQEARRRDLLEQLDTMEQEARRSLTDAQQPQE
jgi:flagellar biosynthesis/type III secretory pathway M-ring protein FliF/YscJ